MVYKTHTAIIGAGAAGLVCAGYCAKNGFDTIVIEKNDRPARKVMITGKGRCNVTNNCDCDTFIKNVKVNGRFLFSAISKFTPQMAMELFEDLSVPLKTERGNRVFPVSDQAVDIVDALVHFCKKNKAKIIHGAANELILEENTVKGVLLANGDQVLAEKVVIATGGLSYPGTGSDGDGYILAKQAGHTIVDPQPSLVPIETRETWCKDLMGLSLRNVTLEVVNKRKNKVMYKELGEMLFTHFGISGPLVLSASSHMDAKHLNDYEMKIDLKPALSTEQLDERIKKDFFKYLNRDFINALGDLYPKKLIPIIVQLSGIDEETKVNQITKEQRRSLVELTKGLKLTVKKFRPINEAIITSGGVSVKEINPKTMESKICKGLYFAGEVMDVDAYTGGFNLQIAYSTAYAAATAEV